MSIRRPNLRIKSFFYQQIDEIIQNRSLRIYGIALALSHLLTVSFWQDRIVTYLLDPICWPAVPLCQNLGSVFLFFSGWIWGIYALISLVTLGLWLTEKWRWAYSLLLFETVLKIAILSFSYQFRGNYHYMMILICLLFLLVPGKVIGLHGLLILFYFFAGTLKLNQEWLSGAALLAPLGLPEPWFTLGFAAVAFLELSLVWLLLSKNPRIFWLAFFGFFLFHAASWPLVRYYFPLTMSCLISLIPIYRIVENSKGPLAQFSPILWSRAAAFVLFLFVSVQLIPFLKPGETALTGEGRIFRLNMLDAYTECHGYGFANYSHKTVELAFNNHTLPVRIHCDPIFFYHRLQQSCDQLKIQNGFQDISFTLLSRKKTDTRWTRVVLEPRFCSRDLKLSTFPVNDWIQAVQQPYQFSEQDIWPASVRFPDQPSTIENATSLPFNPQQLKSTQPPLAGHQGLADKSGFFILSHGKLTAFDQKLERIWQFRFRDPGQKFSNPIIYGDHLVLGSSKGQIYKIDKNTGRLKWISKINSWDGLVLFSEGQNLLASVTSKENTGYLVRLDSDSGEPIWISSPGIRLGRQEPIINPGEGLIYVVHQEQQVSALDLETGERVWNWKSDSPIEAYLIFQKQSLLILNSAQKLMSLSSASGQLIWSQQIDQAGLMDPLAWESKELVVVPNQKGVFRAFSTKTGKNVWELERSDFGHLTTTPFLMKTSLNSEKLFVFCGQQKICLINSEGRLELKLALKHIQSGILESAGQKINIFKGGDFFFWNFE